MGRVRIPYVQRPSVVTVVLDGQDASVTAVIQIHESRGIEALVVE